MLDKRNGLEVGTDEHFNSIVNFIYKKINTIMARDKRFEYDDLFSNFQYTYVKCCKAYNNEYCFTTLLNAALDNEYKMMIRHINTGGRKCESTLISFDTPLEGFKSKAVHLSDVEGKECDELEESYLLMTIKEFKRSGELSRTEEAVLDYLIEEGYCNQEELCNKLGVTQCYICRVLKSVKFKLRRYIESC